MTTGQTPPPTQTVSLRPLEHHARLFPRRPTAKSATAHADAALPIFAILFAATLAVVATWSPLLPTLPAPVRDTAKAFHAAIAAFAPKFLFPMEQPISVYDAEQQMTASELIDRWEPIITQASARFGVPQSWIRAVIRQETGGRTMSDENHPITSRAGAMGLMQIMPQTYRALRGELGLGRNPYAPYDNIMAGTAYLRTLHGKYGYPAMFAAYNDGPGNYERRMADGEALPAETQNYLVDVAAMAGDNARMRGGDALLTRPNGTHLRIARLSVRDVREPFRGEYAPSVHAVITMGRRRQGVRESVAQVDAKLGLLGGTIEARNNGRRRLTHSYSG